MRLKNVFYNQNGEPYRLDTLPDEDEYVIEYDVNGEWVAAERYRKERNRYEELYSEWF